MDLYGVTGLNIVLNEDTGILEFGGSVTCETDIHIPLNAMSPILLNKFLRYPERVYTEHKNVRSDVNKHNDELTYDLIHIPQGLLGIEYTKTHIYYSQFKEGKFDCIVEVVNGSVTVFIQKNHELQNPELNTNVENIIMVELHVGDRFAVPTGFMYTFVNTGNTHSVISLVTHKNHSPIDYSMLKKEKGLAYYIISKNAKSEIVANPKYRVTKHPRQKCISELDDDFKLKCASSFINDSADSLYTVLQKNTESFLNMLSI